MRDHWHPAQYELFKDERSRPFFDLLRLVEPREGMRAVDLGCGTGELTAVMHQQLSCKTTLGIDNSAKMLEQTAPFSVPGLEFRQQAIEEFLNSSQDQFDLVFSNAALQWVDDHPVLLEQIAKGIAPQGQLAAQVPANHDHPAQTVAQVIARREPYATALQGFVRDSPVLGPEEYAELLHGLGFKQQHVRLQVYGHLLPDRDAVAEWTRGTVLTDYERRMPPDLFASFWGDYKRELAQQLEDVRPYFFPFKRTLMWASR